VLDGVCIVWAGLLEESLKVVCQWSCLVLDNAPDGRDILHIVVVRFFVIIIITIAGRGSNPLRVPLSPILDSHGR
jgi:hypothetical protein